MRAELVDWIRPLRIDSLLSIFSATFIDFLAPRHGAEYIVCPPAVKGGRGDGGSVVEGQEEGQDLWKCRLRRKGTS